jgi:hypothetical protein
MLAMKLGAEPVFAPWEKMANYTFSHEWNFGMYVWALDPDCQRNLTKVSNFDE